MITLHDVMVTVIVTAAQPVVLPTVVACSLWLGRLSFSMRGNNFVKYSRYYDLDPSYYILIKSPLLEAFDEPYATVSSFSLISTQSS